MDPVYGEPGMDSTIYRPASEWYFGTVLRKSYGVRGMTGQYYTYGLRDSSHGSSTVAFNFARISVWRNESIAFLVELSNETTIYSIFGSTVSLSNQPGKVRHLISP